MGNFENEELEDVHTLLCEPNVTKEQEKTEQKILGDTTPEPKPEPGKAYDLNDVDSVGKEASKIPDELKINHRKIFALTRRLEGTQKRMQELTSKMYQEASEEKIPGGKKFQDQKSIDRETQKILEESSSWIKKKSEIYMVVDNEKDESKKKYTSEKAREAETRTRLYNENEIKILNARIRNSVIEEKESDKYKFTNDKSREYEANRRVFELKEHQLLQQEERKTIEQQQECRETINYLNKRWDYMKMIISLMEVKYRIL